jgi:hypothetical protein
MLLSQRHDQLRYRTVLVYLDPFECHCALPFLLGPRRQLFPRVGYEGGVSQKLQIVSRPIAERTAVLRIS